MDGVVYAIRPAGNQLSDAGRRPGRHGHRKIIGKGFLGSERPVLIELAPSMGGQPATQIEAEINPRFPHHQRRSVALKIFSGKITATAPQALAVGNHHFAVIAQIGSPSFG